MIAEILLVLAGHSSSLFPTDHSIDPALVPLLHPGERDCLESLCKIAQRYRVIKSITSSLSKSPSQYLSALCAALNQILKQEYEALVVDTEAQILKRGADFVASGSFVPLSAIRATFSEWDAPLVALESLLKQLQDAPEKWTAGPLIDLLISRSRTGVHRIASILQRLSRSVQRVWRSQLATFIIHGTISPVEPIATTDYTLIETATPSCISDHTRASITYVGRAIGTIRAAKWHIQLPRELASKHSAILETVFPEDRHRFDRAVSAIRTDVSEWMWLNVLTQKDAEDAVDSLANYLLLRNGEFALSLIREIERLRSSSKVLIREQDLHLALLRASMGTTAQHDPLISRLRFSLPSGPLRLLLPVLGQSTSGAEFTTFDDLLLGTPLALNYTVSWPLDLFLHPQDLQVYGALFGYLSALRKTHTRIHTCWTSLSNSQRVRRRWTGLGEGGTNEDLESRRELLRCGWGVVRELNWFLDSLLAYTMVDVIDVEWRRLRMLLAGTDLETQASNSHHSRAGTAESTAGSGSSHHLDFSTLRTIHHDYLERIVVGTLLSNQPLTVIIRSLLQLCDQFVAQIERWGGDVLPELLIEGSINNAENERVGDMVRERLATVAQINQMLHSLLESFYEQLTLSTSQQPFVANADASKSVLINMSTANISGFQTFIKRRRGKGDGEVRRHVERLLLRLDFSGEFSKPRKRGHIGEQRTIRDE